jgi:hypothetical protein
MTLGVAKISLVSIDGPVNLFDESEKRMAALVADCEVL